MIEPVVLQTLLYTAGGLTAALALAWYWTRCADKKVFSERLQVSESRTRSAENRVTLLKDQLVVAQSDVALLRERMEKERLVKAAEISDLRQTLQRGAVILAGYALGIGIFFGGTVSWICTGARAEARHLQRVINLEVDTRLAQAQKNVLETELFAWKKENKDLREMLRTALEDKTVALAKLDVILGGFNPEKLSRGFFLDQKKLIQDWSRHERLQPPEAPAALTNSLPL